MSRKIFWQSVGIIGVVVVLTYAPAMRLNFYGDDYSFIEKAGRSSLLEYLAFYFDPRLQTGWYRPLQGMYFGIEYLLFGSNPIGYHVFNVLVHLANCLLLWAIVWGVLKNQRIALIAALVYAGLPLYGVAVFWPGDADFFLSFFYLCSIFFWILYLQACERRFYLAAMSCFWLALLTKEFGVTLPVLLFFADRLIVRERITLGGLVRRYAPFVAIWTIYLPLEYFIQSRSVLTNIYHYAIGNHSVSNFFNYLAALSFPWGLPEPANYAWLIIAAILCVIVLIARKSAPLLFLGIAAMLAFLPVVNFPWFFTRYLYLSVMASAIVLAILFEVVQEQVGTRRVLSLVASAVLTLVVLGDGWAVASAVADFAEIGRQTRVPFRDITQRHATFPEDTYLYFVDAPSPISEYSGMFFLRYGPGVHVSGNTSGDPIAHLRGHKNASVIYFDTQQRTREIPVNDTALVVSTPTDFGASIRLVGFEMPSSRSKRGDAFVVILYWQATKSMSKDYSVFLRLVDATTGHVLVQSDGEPHSRPLSSSWKPGELVVDARVLAVPEETPIGAGYRLQLQLFDPQTMRVLPLRNGQGMLGDDSLIIQPVAVE